MDRLLKVALIVAASFGGSTPEVLAGDKPASPPAAPVTVPQGVVAAVSKYLAADSGKDKAELDRALEALDGDVLVAAAALRAHLPLSDRKPGVHHRIALVSGGRPFEYSILLPKTYDEKRRFPVLVLPDHGSVSAQDGIGFWADMEGAEELIVFRPSIAARKDDAKVFPERQFFALDAAMAAVMRDALAHLRLHYAVDHDRISMTGLSQAGWYTWYYGLTLPDQFAAIVPEASGGTAIKAVGLRLAPNASSLAVRILHGRNDAICPYADAVSMDAAVREAGAAAELITFEAADYGGKSPKFHPGPHHLRGGNVVPWILGKRRSASLEFTRVLRHP